MGFLLLFAIAALIGISIKAGHDHDRTQERREEPYREFSDTSLRR